MPPGCVSRGATARGTARALSGRQTILTRLSLALTNGTAGAGLHEGPL